MRWSNYRDCVIALHLLAEGRYLFAGEDLEVRGPYLCLIVAGEKCGSDLAETHEAYWCRFDADFISSGPGGQNVVFQWGGTRICRSHMRPLCPDEASTALGVLRSLITEAHQPTVSAQLAAGGHLHRLLSLWASPSRAAGRRRPAAQRGAALIEQHLHDPEFTLEAFAEHLGLTPGHLSRLFKKEYGKSPVTYRTEMRLLRARQLLSSTDLPIAEIGRKVGFPDPNYFARVFRKTYGISPREFAAEASFGPSRS